MYAYIFSSQTSLTSFDYKKKDMFPLRYCIVYKIIDKTAVAFIEDFQQNIRYFHNAKVK